MDIAFIGKALLAAARHIPATLLLAFAPLLLGLAPGLLAALARHFRVPGLAQVLSALVTFVKGVPIVLMLLAFYVLCSDTLGLAFRYFPKELIAIAAMSVYATAALSEVFRGALGAVRKGQYDAAFSAGLTTRQTLRRVVLPQALPVSLPMICNVLIALIKAAAMASLVSVIDIMNGAVIAAAENYKFLEAYVAAALLYWAICVIVEKGFRLAESRLSERIRRTG
jgi:L-cystine transport system permease protein